MDKAAAALLLAQKKSVNKGSAVGAGKIAPCVAASAKAKQSVAENLNMDLEVLTQVDTGVAGLGKRKLAATSTVGGSEEPRKKPEVMLKTPVASASAQRGPVLTAAVGSPKVAAASSKTPSPAGIPPHRATPRSSAPGPNVKGKLESTPFIIPKKRSGQSPSPSVSTSAKPQLSAKSSTGKESFPALASISSPVGVPPGGCGKPSRFSTTKVDNLSINESSDPFYTLDEQRTGGVLCRAQHIKLDGQQMLVSAMPSRGIYVFSHHVEHDRCVMEGS